jgi:hypothetical protein
MLLLFSLFLFVIDLFRLINQLKGQSIGVLMSVVVLLIVDVSAAVLVVFGRYRSLLPYTPARGQSIGVLMSVGCRGCCCAVLVVVVLCRPLPPN